MTPINSNSHWMVRVAQRANLLGERTPDVPQSASSEDAWRTVARAAGADDYLTKAAGAARFLARVKAIIRRSRL